jgi:hypothetical protein
MYTTPADAADMSWNNGAAIGTATGATSTTAGKANTDLIVTIDADGTTGGFQQHQAPQYCYDLVAHGQSDWYLPARTELDVLYANRVAIGGFSAKHYWSSTEGSPVNGARRLDFTDGTSGQNGKNIVKGVRCVRNESAACCPDLGACTKAGEMKYMSGSVAFCAGTEWVSYGPVSGNCSSCLGPPILDLEAHWKLDESSGSLADATGNGHTGTLRNGATMTTGKINNGISLDGTNDYFDSPDSTAYTGLTQVTVTAWVKLDANSAQTQIVFKSHGSAPWYTWQLFALSNEFQFDTNTTGGAALAAGSTIDPAINTWYHLAGVYSNGTMKIYVNGADNTSWTSGAGSGTLLDSNGVLSVGGNSGSQSTDGIIDDVRIYTRALTAGEISAIYSAGSTCP